MLVLPWYERGPDGVWTGREWESETQAAAEVAPGCTVHQETAARVGLLQRFAVGRFTQWVSPAVVRPRVPRGFGKSNY
jgi:hypothetical protein